MESTLHTDTWESHISRPCGLVANTPHRRMRVCRQTYKRPRGEHAVLTSESYRVSPCGLEAITSPGWRTSKKPAQVVLLPRWTGHRSQESNQSLSFTWGTHIYCCYRGSQRGVSAVQQRRREVLPLRGSAASKTAWGASARNLKHFNSSTGEYIFWCGTMNKITETPDEDTKNC